MAVGGSQSPLPAVGTVDPASLVRRPGNRVDRYRNRPDWAPGECLRNLKEDLGADDILFKLRMMAEQSRLRESEDLRNLNI